MKSAPKMNQRHFEFIADIIRSLQFSGYEHIESIEHVAATFTEALKATNPSFKPDTFYDACLFTKEELAARKEAERKANRRKRRHARPNLKTVSCPSADSGCGHE